MNKSAASELRLVHQKPFDIKGKPGVAGRFILPNQHINLEQYLDISPFIFLVLDTKGRLCIINKKGCEILGYRDKKQLIGKSWFSNFIPPTSRKIYRNIFYLVLEKNIDLVSSGDREAAILRKDGSTRIIKWSYGLARNGMGQPVGIICSGEDITDKKELESKFMKALLEGQELERKRIAQDLHDGLAVLLTSARMNIGAIETGKKMTEKKQRKLTNNTLSLLASALAEVRNITLNLSPVVLRDFGLVTGLKVLCDKLNKSRVTRIKLRHSGLRSRLAPATETAVYRIAQELIHNALRHSRAKRVYISLFKQGNILTLTIEDDGMGFSTARLFDHEGWGLKNIRSRVRNLHGFFFMESWPGKGTMGMVEIPLKPERQVKTKE